MGTSQNPNPSAASAQAPVMLVLGDSVMWGQGLIDEDKFYQLVFGQLSQRYPGMQPPVMCAHSGAKIGRGDTSTWPALPGEIPASGPTILHQCDQYPDPSSVRVVLMDGGINDADITVFLNPTTLPSTVTSRINKYCHDDMVYLLEKVAQRYSHPECRIILLGYFPILGKNSDQDAIPALLEARGIPNAERLMRSAAAISDPRDLAVQFWHESDQCLKAAAAEVNETVGNNRITYILPPFQEQNALFESDPWLWGFGPGLGFPPEDQVAEQRRGPCVLLVKNWFECQECLRASLGHPNATGAIKYYEAIMSAFPR